jgi:hypothetical protein
VTGHLLPAAVGMTRTLFAPRRRPGHAAPDAGPGARTWRLGGVLLSLAGPAVAIAFLGGGTALAYWLTTDSSNPAAAQAATLSAPTAGEQTGQTPGSVSISWTAPAGYTPTSYTVSRCLGSSCTPATAITSGGCSGQILTTSCTDTDGELAPGKTYSYAVTAVLDNWVSPPSAAFRGSTTPASQLNFTVQPGPDANIQATGTGTFTVSVAVQDSGGNTVTSDNSDDVTLAIGTNPSGGVLSCTNNGDLTVQAVAGVANFTGCSITKAGTGYKLTASSSTSPSLSAPTNANAFNIVAGTASQLAFTTQPASGANIQATGTGTFAVAVAVQDQNGNTVTSDSGRSITLGIGTNPSGGVLSCTNAGGLTVSDASGVSNFTGCAITLAGTGYKLTASASPLAAPANANAFNIVAGAPDYLSFSNITVPVTGATTATCTPDTTAHTNSCSINNLVALTSFTANVTLLDQNGNPATLSSPLTVSLSASGLSSVSPGSVTIPANASTSSATFTETLSLGAGTVTAKATVNSATFQSTIAPGLP